MKLTTSLAAIGTANFEDALADELSKLSDELPLEKFAMNGGWPDPSEWPDVSIQSIEPDEEAIHASVIVAFTESVPSSCKDFNRTYSAVAHLRLTIDKTTGETEVQAEEPEMREEF
ncbi:MAG: hypothetical protein ACLQNE_17200 [Thermoguttaceae bacterium]